MKRLLVLFLAAACVAVPYAAARAQSAAPPAATPSPAPAPVIKAKPRARATPAPPKDTPKRDGISGVWEIQIQRPSGTTYTHFKIAQTDNVLTGEYLDATGKKFPLAGSIDGKTVRVVVSLPDGSTLVFSGEQDGFTDMIGVLDSGKNSVPFSAAYRPKYKWLDNLSPNPGMGTP